VYFFKPSAAKPYSQSSCDVRGASSASWLSLSPMWLIKAMRGAMAKTLVYNLLEVWNASRLPHSGPPGEESWGGVLWQSLWHLSVSCEGGGSTKKRKIFEILFFFTKLAKIEWNIIRNS
jgi:hypothetical protein